MRDGAYLLPAPAEQAAQLQTLADEALQEGGQAWLLRVHAHGEAAGLKNHFSGTVRELEKLLTKTNATVE